MKTIRTLIAVFGALLVALLFMPSASAECGGMAQPAGFASNRHSQFGQAQLLRSALTGDDAQDSRSNPTIVGLWHVKLFSRDTPGLKNNTEVDAGYSEWHSDGTEILNSGGHAPITSNFCLGVWTKTGDRTYRLNHFAIAWNKTGTALVGPAQLQESITLSPTGNYFSGVFTSDLYDEAGNKLAHVQGVITGSRITVNSKPQSVF